MTKDKVAEVLDRGKVEEIVKSNIIVSDQILDSLPKEDEMSITGVIEKVNIDEIVDQICSLIPEHKWVQTTDDKGNVIVPLGEVIAKGEVMDDVAKLGNKSYLNLLEKYDGKSGTLVWVPDKEVE